MRHSKTKQIFTAQIASVALGIEALDLLLVEKGVLGDGELMERVQKLILEKSENAANHSVNVEAGQ